MKTCTSSVKAIARRLKLAQGALLTNRQLNGLVPRDLSCALATILDPLPAPTPPPPIP